MQCLGRITIPHQVANATYIEPTCQISIVTDLCQSVAIVERIRAYTCDAATNCYACQVATTTERTIANACDAVGDYNACQTSAITECILTNTCDTTIVRYNTCFAAKDKRCRPCVNQTVVFVSIPAVSFFHNDTCQSGTIVECIRINVRDAATDCNACQVPATTERTAAYACDIVGNYQIAFYLCSVDIQCFGRFAILHQVVKTNYIEPTCQISIVTDLCQAAAIFERIRAYTCDTVRNCDACQFAAITERMFQNKRTFVVNITTCNIG